MKVECQCGFVGSLRPHKFLDTNIGRCYGCDRVYEQKNEKVVLMETPESFGSWAELEKFYNKAIEGKSPETEKKKRSRSRRNKPAEKDQSKDIKFEAPETPVYKTIHLYVRPGDTWEQVLKDAREEVNFAGPGTVVFAHNHKHGEPETDSCREVRAK